MVNFKDITLQKIYDACDRIKPFILQTPILQSSILSKKYNKNIGLKLENLQPTGAFKLRGATNAILNMTQAERDRGVVTVSTGNHGKALAYVAKKLGMKSVVICVSSLVPKVKVVAMEELGAKVVIVGDNQDEATENALEMQEKEGLRYISAYDDPDIIAGQGTIALEILEQRPETDTLIVPLSGGGLMSGLAFTAKALRPNIKIIGVTNDKLPAMYMSIRAGHIVQVGEEESIADALTGPISADNQYTFEMCKRYVDDMVLVTEEQIAQALAHALLKEKQVLEGGGAATIAAILDEKCQQCLGQNIVAVCSGNSIDMNKLLLIADKYKSSDFRL